MRNGNSCQRTTIYHGRSSKVRRSSCITEKQNTLSIHCQRIAKEIATLCSRAKDYDRCDLHNPKRPTDEPNQHLAGNEKSLCAGKGKSTKSVPPQSAPLIRTNLLWYRKGYCQARRYSRSQQHQHHTNLYYHYRQ